MNQLAGTLIKGKFTRDEWNHLLCLNHLLRLFNVMNFSMFSCSYFLSNRKQSIMSKRAQESKTEGLAVAKPKRMSLVSRNFLSAKKTSSIDSGASNSPGNEKLDQRCVSRGQGNRCETVPKIQLRILKSGNMMAIRFEAQGNLCGVVSVRDQKAQGNQCEVSITSLKGPGWNTTICKSPTIDEPSTEVESQKTHKYLT